MPTANKEPSIFVKLYELQTEIDPIRKESTNPFFKSKYFDINALISELKPHLKKLKLVLLQPLTSINNEPAISTILVDVETGEKIESSTPLPKVADAQKFGSAITYLRRYAIQSLLFLESEEDDDGHSSSTPIKSTILATSPAKKLMSEGMKQAVVDKKLSEEIVDIAKSFGGEVIDEGKKQKKCPFCNSYHNGYYAKCKNCFKDEMDGRKLVLFKDQEIKVEEIPFP